MRIVSYLCFVVYENYVLSLFCCLWKLCLIFVLLFGRFSFLIVVLFLWLIFVRVWWRAHLLSGKGPPSHLPDDKAKGVHIRCLERLKAWLVQRLIQHLKWHIENWRLSKTSLINKPLEPCSALFLLSCWGQCRFRLFHCQTWSRESCRTYRSLYLSVWQIWSDEMYVSQKLPDCETKVGNGTTAVPLNQDVLCLDVSEKYHDRSVFGFDVIANS